MKADEPGLLAYTESAQLANKKKAKGKRKQAEPVKTTYKRTSGVTPVQYTARRRKEAKLEFDDSSRKEFLTGFEKRKQQRRAKARRELEAKAKEDLRAQRRLQREELRERARGNVQAERDFYGDKYEGGLGEEEEEEEEETRGNEPEIQEFDTGDHLTTVTMVDDWDPSAVDDELLAAEQGSKAKAKAKPKPQPQPKPKAEKSRRKPSPPPEEPDIAPADEITALVDPEAQASMLETDAVLVKHLKKVDAHANQLAKNKADFHYESKAERLAQLEKIKEKRIAAAEKRKEEKIAQARADPSKRPKKHKKQIAMRLPEHVKRARAKKAAKRESNSSA